jgi:hypothetical protein
MWQLACFKCPMIGNINNGETQLNWEEINKNIKPAWYSLVVSLKSTQFVYIHLDIELHAARYGGECPRKWRHVLRNPTCAGKSYSATFLILRQATINRLTTAILWAQRPQ